MVYPLSVGGAQNNADVSLSVAEFYVLGGPDQGMSSILIADKCVPP